MLGPIEFDKWFWQMPEKICDNCPKDIDCECGFRTAKENGRISIDWAIFGGESGPNARQCAVEWIRDGVRQCRAAGVNAFVKQIGAVPFLEREVGTAKGGFLEQLRLKDRKGGDMSEWPEDLRVREFPDARLWNEEGKK